MYFSSSLGAIFVIDPTRVLAVYRRNLLVWRKLAPASLVGNVAEPLITLLAFGYGLGALMRTAASGKAGPVDTQAVNLHKTFCIPS
jgi:hypothetical protein